jgi:hypothetical protein
MTRKQVADSCNRGREQSRHRQQQLTAAPKEKAPQPGALIGSRRSRWYQSKWSSERVL